MLEALRVELNIFVETSAAALFVDCAICFLLKFFNKSAKTK